MTLSVDSAVMAHHLPLNVIQLCTEAVELTSISRNHDGATRNLRPSTCWCVKNIHEKSVRMRKQHPITSDERNQISFSRAAEKEAHKRAFARSVKQSSEHQAVIMQFIQILLRARWPLTGEHNV